MVMDKRLCVALNNVTFKQGGMPLRVTVFGKNTICNLFNNLANAVINAVYTNIQLDFIGNTGKLVDGKWNGAMGQLVDNGSDVVVGSFTTTYERFQYAAMSTPIGHSSPVAIFSGRIAQKTLQNDFHIFKTFSLDVWTAIIISIIIVAITDCIMHEKTIGIFIDNIISSYSSMLGQGSQHYTNYCCVKHVILLTVSLGCFSVLRYYFGTYLLMDNVQNS